MRPPLLLPEPRVMRMERGTFLITEDLCVCLAKGCGEPEALAAEGLVAAIIRYGQVRAFVEWLEGREPSGQGIVLKLDRPSANALSMPRNSGCLRSAVISTKLVSEDEILEAIAKEMEIEKISLKDFEPTPEVLQSIDPKTAATYLVFPVRVTPEAVYLAHADPMHIGAIEEIERILNKTVIQMVAPEDEIRDAIRRYYRWEEGFSELADVLVKQGLIREDMVRDLLLALEKMEPGWDLRRQVLETGLVKEEELLNAIARSLNLEKVSLAGFEPSPEALSAMTHEYVRWFQVFPVRLSAGALHVATADPLNRRQLRLLEQILGCGVVPVAATEKEVRDAIDRSYPTDAPASERTGPGLLPSSSISGTRLRREKAEEAPAPSRDPEGYSITITNDRIDVTASTCAGLFYGVQTLIQLVRFYGNRLPALRIEDEPDFRHRGFMLDVSRGRVPTVAYLKSLVDLLAHFKINMLQLYIEHSFMFASHPEIGQACSPLSPGELTELDRYCRSRHIDLVPSLQSFGHMGYILSLPQHRRLAEIVRFEDWAKATWRQRMRGMTLTPVEEGTYRLLGELYDDFLPVFRSKFFNLNSDETWDLGKGRSQALAGEVGVGRVYLAHILRIADMARRRGRTPMIWSDIMYQHAGLLPEVPDDIVFLDWGYEHDSPFDRCARLAEAGRKFFVCPGTSGWNQLVPDVWNSTFNIRQFVRAGKENGAIGVLNTDWGDCGHFNLPALSYYGAVLGAATAWNEGRPDQNKLIDQGFALHVFDDRRDIVGRAVHRAGSLIRERIGRRIYTWELWTTPLGDGKAAEEIPPQAAVHINRALTDMIEWMGSLPHEVLERGGVSCNEISFALSMLDTLALRALIEHRRLGTLEGEDPIERFGYKEWAEHVVILRRWFETLWRHRSKPSRLEDILVVFDRQIADARALSG